MKASIIIVVPLTVVCTLILLIHIFGSFEYADNFSSLPKIKCEVHHNDRYVTPTTSTALPKTAPTAAPFESPTTGRMYNIGELVENMKQTQRGLIEAITTNIEDPKKRWEAISAVFQPAMLVSRQLLKLFSYSTSDEAKYWVPFQRNNSECLLVTLGVGGSWDGEKKLRARYPGCQLIGVDPDEKKNKPIVESIPNSMFVKAVVAEKAGKFNSSVMINGTYTTVEMAARGLAELLQTEVQNKTVDFLSVDVEGAEFGIIRLLQNNRNMLPVICQLNIEFHAGDTFYNVSFSDMESAFRAMLSDAHFIMFRNQNVPEYYNFKRIGLLNIGDVECLEKFLH